MAGRRTLTCAPLGCVRPGQRVLILVGFIALTVSVPDGGAIALDAMSEAYLAVAVFVAGTLMLVFAAERYFKTDVGVWLDRRSTWQIPAATLLGAFPGCGGAIIAVTQFTRGYLSFGSVVATLTATMGDAIFLLLARKPDTALLVVLVSMIAGLCCGYAVDYVHGPNFLRPAAPKRARHSETAGHPRTRTNWRLAGGIWFLLVVPGIVLGVLGAFQVDVDSYAMALFNMPIAHWLGVTGAALGLVMWVARDGNNSGLVGERTDAGKERLPLLSAVVANTNFVMAWVVFAFIGYELLIASSGLNLAELFAVWAPIVPALAILVGFIPGCGPQIVVTSLYLSGTLPLSAQFGNTIANDGDALFPAIAVAPKAAIVATLYSALPAAVVAYGWYMMCERQA